MKNSIMPPTNKTKLTAVFFSTLLGFVTLVAFQNCAKVSFPEAEGTSSSASTDPSNGNLVDPAQLVLIATASPAPENQPVTILLRSKNVREVGYYCKDALSGEVLATGQAAAPNDEFTLTIDRDIVCRATGIDSESRRPIQADANILVNCAPRAKDLTTNRCL